jgi:tetratricopeptide (TPR) repeat protein
MIKTACILGFLLLGLALGLYFRTRNSILPAQKSAARTDFYQRLYLFDNVLSMEDTGGGLNHTHTGNLLKELEKSAVGAESWLSLLKRYRKLAKRYAGYDEGYRAAVALAEKKYPHSALIAALSAETALSAGAPAEKLKKTALRLSESGPLLRDSFFPPAFCLYAVSGVFDTVDSARSVKHSGGMFDAFTVSLRGAGSGRQAEQVWEAMLVDAALLKIVDGRGEEAADGLARLEPGKAALPVTLSFIAGYSFDFADQLLAAELWVKAGGEKNLARAASALYMAGETENARKLWLLLIANGGGGAGRGRFLYNMAATAAGDSEKKSYLEQLLDGTENDGYDKDAVNAGLVMYSRLQPEDRAGAILRLSVRQGASPNKGEALIDLEHLRRKLETTTPDRAVAETWLLLNRNPDVEEIYRWAGWYFEYQRRYDDLKDLLRFAGQNGVESPYLAFHRALELARDGNIQESLELLESSDGIPAWQRRANAALLLYARREYAAALGYWEEAAAMLPSGGSDFVREAGARIYLKMARCRRILGGGQDEIRRDLERARALDGENIVIRLELSKFGSPWSNTD